MLSYTPIDLGVLADAGPTPASYAMDAYAINDAHQVVGASATATSSMHAVLWDNNVLTDLGTLGGATSLAQDINDAGQVAGWANTASGAFHAFLWENGVMTDLGVAATNSVFSPGYEHIALNDAGVVVGWTGETPQSFIWENGVVLDFAKLLPANSGWSYLRIEGVNDAGQIVGSGALNGAETAFLYKDTDGDGKFATGPGQIISLGALGGYPYSYATVINDLGQVAGSFYKYGGSRAFLWTPTAANGMSGTMSKLAIVKGSSSSSAWGLTDSGDVVGSVGFSTTNTSVGVIWPGGGQPQDLNAQVANGSPVLARANAVSNDGWILDGHYLVMPGSVDVPLVSISDATVTEGDDGTRTAAVFTVTLSKPSTDIVTLRYSTGSGLSPNDPKPDVDYVATSDTLTFMPGETTKTITVEVIGDTIPELSENLPSRSQRFAVNLTSPANALFTDAHAIGNIIDDDGRLSINDVSLVEGDSGTAAFVFTVTLSKAASVDIDVGYKVSGGSATVGSDYVATSGTLTFAAGQTTKTITVPVIGDTIYEPDETFFVQLSSTTPTYSPYAIFTDAQGIGTIRNNDPSPKPGGGKK